MKRIISVVLIALLLCSIIPIACFADENDTRASNYFASYGATLSRQSDGRIKIVFSATGTAVCSKIGVATYQIQQRTSGGSWSDYGDLMSGQTGSGVRSYSFSKYFTPSSGKEYRVKCTFTCTLNGSTEYKAYTSGIV